MESGPLSTKEFVVFGERVVLFCHISTGIESDPDQGLMQEKGGVGFPYLAFLDSAGDVVHQQVARTVEALESSRDCLVKLARYEQKLKVGDETARTPIFVAKLKLVRYELETARRRRKALVDVSAEQKQVIDQLMLNLEVNSIRTSHRRDRAVAGKSFAAMLEKGRIPTGEELKFYWIYILEYAREEENAALYERGLLALKKDFGNDKLLGRDFPRWEKQLQSLKEGPRK